MYPCLLIFQKILFPAAASPPAAFRAVTHEETPLKRGLFIINQKPTAVTAALL
jgi:hypothetical protein